MALDPKAQAALALHRFGVGPRAGSIAAIASDPRGALLAELDRPGAGRISDADLLTSGVAARVAFAYQQAQRAARQAERAAQPATALGSGGAPEMKDETPPASAPRPNPGPSVPQQIYLAEAKARIHAALAADIGFVERLVWFWSNHFCVSADKGNVRQICGAYEREVIRANVLGRFGDMLLARFWNCIRSACVPSIRRTTSLVSPMSSQAGPWCRFARTHCAAASSISIRACISPARRR